MEEKKILTPEDIKEVFKNILLSYYKENLYKESRDNVFIVHYPEITIQNSLGRSHKIYDLFVRLSCYINANIISIRFEGTRISFTPKEVEQGYCHSHLSQTINYGWNFTDFCLGTGHLISYSNIRLNNCCDILYTLPAALDRYVEWESLEGGPYRRISSLGESSSSVVNFSSSTEKNLLKKITTYHSVMRDSALSSTLDFYMNSLNNLPVFGIKINNVIYSSKDVPIPKENNEDIVDIKKMATVTLTRVLDDSVVSFDCKKITKPSLDKNEDAQVINLTSYLLTSINITSSSVTNLIKNKKNEFIQFT